MKNIYSVIKKETPGRGERSSVCPGLAGVDKSFMVIVRSWVVAIMVFKVS